MRFVWQNPAIFEKNLAEFCNYSLTLFASQPTTCLKGKGRFTSFTRSMAALCLHPFIVVTTVPKMFTLINKKRLLPKKQLRLSKMECLCLPAEEVPSSKSPGHCHLPWTLHGGIFTKTGLSHHCRKDQLPTTLAGLRECKNRYPRHRTFTGWSPVETI